jgi:hypothetical protein
LADSLGLAAVAVFAGFSAFGAVALLAGGVVFLAVIYHL